MFIECYKCFNDQRYYVPTFVITKRPESLFKINFLVDTGASTTLLSWNDVPYTTLQTNLREGRTFTGLGGSVKAFILSQCSLLLYADTGIYNLAVDELDLSNYLTVDGRLCPPAASVLGIDILNKFDISISDDLERLFLTQSNRK
ncbi:MAG TPA: hypothetical protein VE130_02875 [Nitrososphaeraceae archaeon]|nr:hypothetical protein [Nitrososphaeraceae archaeon]